MEGSIKAQRVDKQEVDGRKVIRVNSVPLIKALVNSIVPKEQTRATATEIAKEIKTIFRFEYRDQGVYKEIKNSTLVTEVRRVLSSRKSKI